MPDLFAACTPNSLPQDGRTEHGWQITVVDDAMAVLDTVDLPEWDTFRQEEAEAHLARSGYALQPSATEWAPAGLGFMAPVVPTSPAPTATV